MPGITLLPLPSITVAPSGGVTLADAPIAAMLPSRITTV